MTRYILNYVLKRNAIKYDKYNNNNFVYLMDNARIHHSRLLKEYKNEKDLKIIYNVPYNPNTNPIEHVFSTIKKDIVDYDTKTIPKLKIIINNILLITLKNH